MLFESNRCAFACLRNQNQVARAIAVHKDADACHPANSAHYFDGQPWSSGGVPAVSGTGMRLVVEVFVSGEAIAERNTVKQHHVPLEP